MNSFSSDEVWKELARKEELTAKARRNKERGAQQVDHWSHAVLLERARYLRKMAEAGQGEASEVIRSYSQHAAHLLVRLRSGPAEVHEKFADIFIVLSGKGTLVTGGTVINPREESAGETRGDRVEGTHSQELRAGDIAHVPAGVPHQMLVNPEMPFAAMVLKAEEGEAKEE